ncbi:MAG: acetyl-CoA acetyltransferase [Acidobacteria bacterium RIFCSPLOWO2_02_FULL_61_28]|nr:MAG: acetyl-CoA acetyltransferase [Acidobacteria bacterium RIFCSPLOWO2_02_FULL_61_28]
MRDAVVVASLRTAVGKAPRGALRHTRPDDMAAAVITALLRQTPGLAPEEIEDVILGCAFPEAEQGHNMARIVCLRAGLPQSVSGMTINRFCSSGLQAIAMASERIMAGFADVIIAGGSESMSLVPMPGCRLAPNPYLVECHPDVYLNMGLTAENIAQQYKIARNEADAFALASHEKAIAAIRSGRYKGEIVPLEVTTTTVPESGNGPGNGRAYEPQSTTTIFEIDEGPRADSSLEALAKLKPVFHAEGTVTAGNSSQMSDGAAGAIVMSAERAKALGLRPLARFLAFAAAGVPPEIMGIGPVAAIPKALRLAGLTLQQMDLIELNEAFAAQALAVIREAGLDPAKVNVNGGAVALGHPLGCTGAKLTATLLHEMKRRGSRYGLVTMCIGGGMGAAGVFENLT